MKATVELQPALLLHSRPFRDTSVLLDFHTRDHGRVTLLARGVRSAKSKLKGVLQPFIPLLVSWRGRSNLKTLTQAEQDGMPFLLRGEALFSGMYLNELLCRLLHEHEADSELFELYTSALASMMKEPVEPVLRRFEMRLLDSLGYGVSFEYAADTGDAIETDRFYLLDTESGFVQAPPTSGDESVVVNGGSLFAIAMDDYGAEQVRRDAKHINRQRLGRLLGDKPLKSRRLFSSRSQRQG